MYNFIVHDRSTHKKPPYKSQVFLVYPRITSSLLDNKYSHYITIYSFTTCVSITLKYSSHTLHHLCYRINCFLLHCWGSSSELSPQSLSPSHNQDWDTQWPLEHEKSLEEHVACSEKENTIKIIQSFTQSFNLPLKCWHIKDYWCYIAVKQQLISLDFIS